MDIDKRNIPADAVPQGSEDVEKDFETCRKEREEYLDGWKRAKADLANYKKEEAERVGKIVKFANEALLHDAISVLDSFEVGIVALEKHEEAQKGMKLIMMQLEEVLRRHGLEPINAPPGADFDPARHEAIGETESEFPEGVVAEETKRGYFLGGKIIRPAKVKLSKGTKPKTEK